MSDGKSQVVRLTREELYDQVWKTPMRLLARSYGISDVGLATQHPKAIARLLGQEASRHGTSTATVAGRPRFHARER